MKAESPDISMRIYTVRSKVNNSSHAHIFRNKSCFSRIFLATLKDYHTDHVRAEIFLMYDGTTKNPVMDLVVFANVNGPLDASYLI